MAHLLISGPRVSPERLASGEPLLEGLLLPAELTRKAIGEAVQEPGIFSCLALPGGPIDRQERLDLCWGKIELACLDALGGRQDADGRLGSVPVPLPVDSLVNPAEHPHVLAEAGPDELAILIAPEPV